MWSWLRMVALHYEKIRGKGLYRGMSAKCPNIDYPILNLGCVSIVFDRG
jgi:hypothetical protein